MSAPNDVTTAADEDPIVAAIVRAAEAEEPWQPVAGDDPGAFNPAADPTGHPDRWAGRCVPADRVRAALLTVWDPDKPRPKRPVLRIRCANLTGSLDLVDVVAEVGVELIACRIHDINLRDAALRLVLLERCHVTGHIFGERLRLSGSLRLDRTTVLGPIDFEGARIEGQHRPAPQPC